MNQQNNHFYVTQITKNGKIKHLCFQHFDEYPKALPSTLNLINQMRTESGRVKIYSQHTLPVNLNGKVLMVRYF